MCGGGGFFKSLFGGILGALLSQEPKQPDNSQAQANADRAFKQAEEANNKANAKAPNTQNLLDENVQAALGGSSSTMLTGSQGIDPAKLLLGKNTLLGQ